MDYLKLIEITGGFLAKLLGLNKERKSEVAGYLEGIADTLGQFPSRVRAGARYEELAGLSMQAKEYASHFREATTDVLGAATTDAFTELLAQAHNAKQALIREPPAERDERLRVISEIAGSFRVTAATLRGSASQLAADPTPPNSSSSGRAKARRST